MVRRRPRRAETRRLARHCDTIDRDPTTIRCSANTFLALHDDPRRAAELAAAAGNRPVLAGAPDQIIEQLGDLAATGLDEVIVVDWNLDDPGERTETLERFSRDVLQALDPQP